MANKLVVIIKSLKVTKIKKILLYEMKFLVPNCSCLRNTWLGGYRPQIPVLSVLCPQLNLLNTPPPPEKKIPGYAAGKSRTPNILLVLGHPVHFSFLGGCSIYPKLGHEFIRKANVKILTNR